VNALAEWLKANWAIAVTAVATAATALLIWLDRRDRKSKELPFVECTMGQAAVPGWVHVTLVVRNFNPYAVYAAELRIRSPKTSAIFNEWEAYERPVGLQPPTLPFVATNTPPKLAAWIDKEIAPIGSIASGFAPPLPAARAIDQIRRTFFYSPGPGRSGRIKVKMALICEVRSRDVRRKEIPIKRVITL
jgi:hypothetical protein